MTEASSSSSPYLNEDVPPPPLDEQQREQQQQAMLEEKLKLEQEPAEQLHLVKPVNTKSRFWTHFMRFDTDFHPDMKTKARCDMCGKIISVKQGTGGLKNHMRFKHPEENAILMESDGDVCVAASSSGGTPSSKAATAITVPAKKRPRGNEFEKRDKEKHVMEMWSFTRREISALRKEIKNEEDEAAIRDLEHDMRLLKKKKAEYAKVLGMEEGDDVEI